MEPSSAYEAGQAAGKAFVYVVLGIAGLGGGIFFIIALIKALTRRTTGWIVGAAVSAIVAFGGVMGLAGVFVSSAVNAAKTGMERKKTMASKDGRFRIEVPMTWRDIPELHEDAQIEAGNTALEQYVLVMENPKSDFVGSVVDFDELIIGQMKETIPDLEVSAPEVSPVGEYPAIHRRLAGTVEKIRIVYQVAVIETDNAFYQVLTWTSPSRENASKDAFRNVIDSFTSDDAPPSDKPAPLPANATVHERVVAIVIDQMALNPETVKPESRFVEDLGADSLDTVELVMAVEEEFEVTIPDEDVEKLRTVADLVSWLEKPRVEVE